MFLHGRRKIVSQQSADDVRDGVKGLVFKQGNLCKKLCWQVQPKELVNEILRISGLA